MEQRRGPTRTQYVYESKRSIKDPKKEKVVFSRLPKPPTGPMDGFSSAKYTKKVDILIDHVDIDAPPPPIVKAEYMFIPTVRETLDLEKLEEGKYTKDVMWEALLLRGVLLAKSATKDEYIKAALEHGVGV